MQEVEPKSSIDRAKDSEASDQRDSDPENSDEDETLEIQKQVEV